MILGPCLTHFQPHYPTNVTNRTPADYAEALTHAQATQQPPHGLRDNL